MANLYRKTIKTLCFLFLLQSHLYAAEVIMFNDQPPSAKEIGTILFPEQTRSVSFGKKNYQPKANSALANEVATSSVGLPIQFSYNSAEILNQSIPFLNEIGKMLNLENYRDKRLLIEGHTDATGSDQYNKILSEKRAQAVKSYLVENHQISSKNLFISGQGESSPILNTDPEAAANRRVQFHSAK